MFIKAQRSQSKLRLALIGPSGSGKTYSALLIAKGLGGKIAMLDSERGSGSLYSDLVDYDISDLTPPFTPERYIEAINQAQVGGYNVLIIDSLSHAWSGQGGILEFVDRASQVQKNNFAAWREASPKHNSLVDAILGADLHIIVTMRSKTAWEVQKDERTGKTRPVKIGLAPVQRDGLEYEFTCVLELSVDGHIATATKDRTRLFDGRYITPDIETGQVLKQWLQGKGEKPVDLLNEIMGHLFKLGLASKLAEYEAYIQGKYGHGLKGLSYNQLKEQITSLERCFNDQELKQKFEAYLLKQAA